VTIQLVSFLFIQTNYTGTVEVIWDLFLIPALPDDEISQFRQEQFSALFEDLCRQAI
jgi:hypothetical protein